MTKFKKREITDSFEIGFDRLLKFPTGVSNFGKNKDNLRLHNFVLLGRHSKDLFVIEFSRFRPFLNIYVQFPI